MLVQVNIADGQVSGVSDLAPVCSSLINWDVDESGANKPRATLQTYTQTGLGAYPVVGLARIGYHLLIAAYDSARERTVPPFNQEHNHRLYYINEKAAPTVATAISVADVGEGAFGLKRPTFVVGSTGIFLAAGYDSDLGAGGICKWDPATPAVFEASGDANAPYPTHIASLGQYLIANDTQDRHAIRWSSLGEGNWSTWPTANAMEAEARPDEVVALAENTNSLFVWGEETTQVYVVGSDPTLPFDCVSTINTGIAAPYCYVRLDEAFVWLDNQRRIVISDGSTVKPISDAIQADLRGLTTISDAWAYRQETGQFSYLVFRFPTEERTFRYDLKAERWSELKRYVAPFQGDYDVGAYVYRQSDNTHLFGCSASTGGLYTSSTNTLSEVGGPLVCERTTGWNTFGTDNRKRSVRLQVTMKRGTAAQGATPGALEVRVQDDDGPWSDWEQVSVGGPDDYEAVKEIYVGGVFRRRRYGLRYSSTDSTALLSLADDIVDTGSP